MTHPISPLLRALALIVVSGLVPALTLALAQAQASPGPTQASADPVSPASPPTEGACGNSRFVKTLTLSRAWIPEPPADILGLGGAISEAIATDLQQKGAFRVTLTPPTRSRTLAPAIDAFARTGDLYFVHLSGHDFTPTGQESAWEFFGPGMDPRGGTIDLTIDNGATAVVLAHSEISAQPIKVSPYTPPIDARGRAFWQSDYGQTMAALSAQAAAFIAQSLRCTPLMGQVLRIEGNNITINRGIDDGLRQSDCPLLLRRSAPLILLGQDHLPERHLLESLGRSNITHLGHRTAQLNYTGAQAVQVGDLVQVGE